MRSQDTSLGVCSARSLTSKMADIDGYHGSFICLCLRFTITSAADNEPYLTEEEMQRGNGTFSCDGEEKGT